MVMPPSGFASWLNRQPTPASNIRPVNTPTNRRDLEGIRGMAQQRLMMPSISQGYRLPAPPPPQSSPAIPSPPSVSSVAPQEHFMRVLPPSPPPQEPTIYQKINQSHMDRGRTEWMPRTVTTGEWDEEKNKPKVFDNPRGVELGPLDRNHYDTFKLYDTGQKSGFGVGDQKSTAMEQMWNDPALADEIAKDAQARRMERGLSPTEYFEDGVKFMTFMNLMNNKRDYQKQIQDKASEKATKAVLAPLYTEILPDTIKLPIWSIDGGYGLKEVDLSENSVYGFLQRNFTGIDLAFALGTAYITFQTGGAGLSGFAPAWAWKEALKAGAKAGLKETAAGLAINAYYNEGYGDKVHGSIETGLLGTGAGLFLSRGKSNRRKIATIGSGAAAGTALGFEPSGVVGDLAGSLALGVGSWKASEKVGERLANLTYTKNIPKGLKSVAVGKGGLPLRQADIDKAKAGYEEMGYLADNLERELKRTPKNTPEGRKIRAATRKTIKNYRNIAKEYNNIDSGFTFGQLTELEKKVEKIARKNLSNKLLEFNMGDLGVTTKWAFEALRDMNLGTKIGAQLESANRFKDNLKNKLDVTLDVKERDPRSTNDAWMDLYLIPKQTRESLAELAGAEGGWSSIAEQRLGSRVARSLEEMYPRDEFGKLVPPSQTDNATNVNHSVANQRHVKENIHRANGVVGRKAVSENGVIIDPDFADIQNTAFEINTTRKQVSRGDEQIFPHLEVDINSPIDEVLTDVASRTVKVRNHIDLARIAFQMYGANMKTAKLIGRISHNINEMLGEATGQTADEFLQSKIKGAIEASKELRPDYSPAARRFGAELGIPSKYKVIEIPEIIDGKATGKMLEVNDPSTSSMTMLSWVDSIDESAKLIHIMNRGDADFTGTTLLHELGHAWERNMKAAFNEKQFKSLEEDIYNSILQGTQANPAQATVETIGNWRPGAPWNQAVKEEFAQRVSVSLQNVMDSYTSSKYDLDAFVKSLKDNKIDDFLGFGSVVIEATTDLKKMVDTIKRHRNVDVRNLYFASMLKARAEGKQKKFIDYDKNLESAIEGEDMIPAFLEGVQPRLVIPRSPPKNVRIINGDKDSSEWLPDFEEMDVIFDPPSPFDNYSKVDDELIHAGSTETWGDYVDFRTTGPHGWYKMFEEKRAKEILRKIYPKHIADNQVSSGFVIDEGTVRFYTKDNSMVGSVKYSLGQNGMLTWDIIKIEGGWAFPKSVVGDLQFSNQFKAFLSNHAWDDKTRNFVRADSKNAIINDAFVADIATQFQLFYPHIRGIIGHRASGAKRFDKDFNVGQFYDFTDHADITNKNLFALDPSDYARVRKLHATRYERMRKIYEKNKDKEYNINDRFEAQAPYETFPEDLDLFAFFNQYTTVNYLGKQNKLFNGKQALNEVQNINLRSVKERLEDVKIIEGAVRSVRNYIKTGKANLDDNLGLILDTELGQKFYQPFRAFLDKMEYYKHWENIGRVETPSQLPVNTPLDEAKTTENFYSAFSRVRVRTDIRGQIEELRRIHASLSDQDKAISETAISILDDIDSELVNLDTRLIDEVPVTYRDDPAGRADTTRIAELDQPYTDRIRGRWDEPTQRRVPINILGQLKDEVSQNILESTSTKNLGGSRQYHVIKNDESPARIIEDTPGENATKVAVVPPVDPLNVLSIPKYGWGLPRIHRVTKRAIELIEDYTPLPAKWRSPESKGRKVLRTEDLYDDEMFTHIINPLVRFIQNGMENSKNVSASISSEIEFLLKKAFTDKSLRGMKINTDLMTEDGRLPFLAGIGTTTAPTVQDVAAKFPLYRDSGLLTDEMLGTFKRIRELLEPYDTLLRNGENINLERDRFRNDILLNDDPSNSGFYIPRGSAKSLSDDFNAFDAGSGEPTRFGGTVNIGPTKAATFDSMSEGLDAGYAYVPIPEAISSYVRGARRLGYQDYFSRVISELKLRDGETPVWWSKKRIVQQQHPELTEVALGDKIRKRIENIESHLYEIKDRKRANRLTLYTKDHDYTKLSTLADDLMDIGQNSKLSRALRAEAREIARTLNGPVSKHPVLKDMKEYRRVGHRSVISVFNEAVNSAHDTAAGMGLDQMIKFHGLKLGDKYYPHALRVILDSAFPAPPPTLRPFRGPEGIWAEAKTGNLALLPKEYLLKLDRWKRGWWLHNRLYSSMGATLDNSAIGINLIFRLGVDAFNSKLGVEAAIDALKIPAGKMTTEELMRKYPSIAAIKANAMILNPLQFPKHSRLINGRLIAQFNEHAIAGGRLTTEQWANYGLRIRGTQHEYSLAFMDRLPLVSRAQQLFGYTGDQARINIADNILESELRRTGKTLQQLQDEGETLRTIATQANRSMGYSPTSDTYDIPSMLLFAPNFFKARLDNIVQTLNITSNQLEQRLARRDMLKFLGSAFVITYSLNNILDEETDVRPLTRRGNKLEWNPNFLRIRWGERDYSLLGPYDSMLRMMVAAAQLDITTFNSVVAGSPRRIIDGVTQSNFFGEPIKDMQFKINDTLTTEKLGAAGGWLAYIIESSTPWGPREASKMVPDFLEEASEKNYGAATIDFVQGTAETLGVKSSPMSFGDLNQNTTEEEYEEGRVSSAYYDSLEPHERSYIRDLVGKENPDLYKDLPQRLDHDSIYMAKSRELNETFKGDERLIFDAYESGTGPLAKESGGKLTSGEARSAWWDTYLTSQQEKSGIRLALTTTFNEEIRGKGTEKQKKALQEYFNIGEKEELSVPGQRSNFFNSQLYRHHVTNFITRLPESEKNYVLRNLTLKTNYPEEWNNLFRESSPTEVVKKLDGTGLTRIYTTVGLQMEIQKARDAFQSKQTPQAEKIFEGGILKPQLDNVGAGIKGLAEKIK